MILQMRIDDRLIHGEVIAIWLTYTGADVVVVADDDTANDPMQRMAMKLAKPEGIKMPICTIEHAIELLNEKGNGSAKILIVTKNAQNARKLVEGCPLISKLNVGAMRASEGKKQVSLKVFVDDFDIKDLVEISKHGVEVYSQTKPDMNVLTLEELKQKAI